MFFVFLILLLCFPKKAGASLLVLKGSGEVVWNVLSQEIALDTPKHSFIEVKKVADSDSPKTSQISLRKDEDKISLSVFSGNQEKEMDVSNWSDDLVEIEERPETQKVKIGLMDGQFLIIHKGIKAVTNLPITVDSRSASILLETPTGKKYLSIFPYEAVESVLRFKLINRIPDEKIEINEEGKELVYKVSGEKVFRLFNFYEYAIPISYRVSASTGEILSFDVPGWLKIFRPLFS